MIPNKLSKFANLSHIVVIMTILSFMLLINFTMTSCKEAQRQSAVERVRIGVSPKPRIEVYGEGNIILRNANDTDLSVILENFSIDNSYALKSGLDLFAKRLKFLGKGSIEYSRESAISQLSIQKCTEKELSRLFRENNVKEPPGSDELRQVYFLETKRTRSRSASVVLKACDSPGIFYALVSLCQLIDVNEADELCIPQITICDWPAVNRRLAKAKASHINSLESIRKFTAWMPVFKLNMIALMDYSENSKEPTELFLENVKIICAEEKQKELLSTIVYFCPFRGNKYDFNKTKDIKEYSEFLLWIMAQGADGIEVDYNDWGNTTDVPIEKVLNIAYTAIDKEYPGSMILFCPPQKGPIKYRGPATDETSRVLSLTPEKVWPLWVGAPRADSTILTPTKVNNWINKAGRKPFLWINRVYPTGLFSNPMKDNPGAYVFKGERLPKEIGNLFEGVHLNMSMSPEKEDHLNQTIPAEFQKVVIEYFATATDFLWNPYDWDANESYKRARRFAMIMMPLLK